MKSKTVTYFTALLLMAVPAISQGSWADIDISPSNPVHTDIIAITLYGWWHNACAPNSSSSSVVDNDIFFDVFTPCNIGIPVVTYWSETEYIGGRKQNISGLYLLEYTIFTQVLMRAYIVL